MVCLFFIGEVLMQISGLGSSSFLTNAAKTSNQQLQKILQKLATGLSINQAFGRCGRLGNVPGVGFAGQGI